MCVNHVNLITPFTSFDATCKACKSNAASISVLGHTAITANYRIRSLLFCFIWFCWTAQFSTIAFPIAAFLMAATNFQMLPKINFPLYLHFELILHLANLSRPHDSKHIADYDVMKRYGTIITVWQKFVCSRRTNTRTGNTHINCMNGDKPIWIFNTVWLDNFAILASCFNAIKRE